MTSKKLVEEWFRLWRTGEFNRLPISDEFKHTSPFGTIKGKQAYLNLVNENKDKFLDYTFDIHDAMHADQKACIRYTARQGSDFALDVSEWHYVNDGLIQEVIAYYHIGDVRNDRMLKES